MPKGPSFLVDGVACREAWGLAAAAGRWLLCASRSRPGEPTRVTGCPVRTSCNIRSRPQRANGAIDPLAGCAWAFGPRGLRITPGIHQDEVRAKIAAAPQGEIRQVALIIAEPWRCMPASTARHCLSRPLAQGRHRPFSRSRTSACRLAMTFGTATPSPISIRTIRRARGELTHAGNGNAEGGRGERQTSTSATATSAVRLRARPSRGALEEGRWRFREMSGMSKLFRAEDWR